MTQVALVVVVVFTASPSRADTAIAGDLDYAVPIDSSADAGGGFGIRLGQQFDLSPIVLTPELAFTYYGFSGDFAPTVYRGTAGLRLGVGKVLRPGAFGHLGIGHMGVDTPGPEGSHTAFTWDIGAFLEFALIPFLIIGVHGGYNHLNGDVSSFQWANVGAHAALVF